MKKAFLLLVALSACSSPPPKEDPKPWPYDESLQGNVFSMMDSTDASAPETGVERLRAKARRRGVELLVKDLIPDERKLARHEDQIAREILDQAGPYVASDAAVEQQFAGGKLSARIKVELKREKLAIALEEKHILHENAQKMRVIVVVQNPAAGVDAANIPEGYKNDLSLDLSDVLVHAGFQATLWKDVRLKMAEKRDAGNQETDKLLTTYVEDSSWRKPDDERYVLPLIYLRTEGRLLVGFQLVELERNELTLKTLMKADIYDLVNSESLGYETETGEQAIGDMTPTAARQKIVKETAQRLAKRMVAKLQAFYDKQMTTAETAPTYTFRFEGFDEGQRSTIRNHLAAIVAENITPKMAGDAMVVTARVNRDPVPLSEEIERSLKLLGIKSHPARIDGTTLAFAKE